jgi:hypothetical protein
MAERVAQRHRTEANGDDPVAVIVINDPPAPAVEVKQEPLRKKKRWSYRGALAADNSIPRGIPRRQPNDTRTM